MQLCNYAIVFMCLFDFRWCHGLANRHATIVIQCYAILLYNNATTMQYIPRKLVHFKNWPSHLSFEDEKKFSKIFSYFEFENNNLVIAVRYGRVPKRSREAISSTEMEQSYFEGSPQSPSPGSNASSEGTVNGVSSRTPTTGSSFSSSNEPSPVSSSTTASLCGSPNTLGTIITQSHLQNCVYTQDRVKDIAPRTLTIVSLRFIVAICILYQIATHGSCLDLYSTNWIYNVKSLFVSII